MRNNVKTYLNSCDLHLQQVKMTTTGYFYIVWKRGKKVTQTLKYYSEGMTTPIQEKLTLSISLNVRNGRTVEKNTSLYILDSQGQQIDQISLPIHRWNSEFRHIQLPLAKGKLTGKARRQPLMEVQGQINSNQQFDVQQSDDLHMTTLLKRSDKLSKNNIFVDLHKDQVSKIRKQLEDTLYYNNKLKNDRTVLITKNLELEGELNMLKKTTQQQLNQLEKHCNNKIEIRDSIYEQEIHQIVAAFNSNYDFNHAIIKSLAIEQQSQIHEIDKYKIESHNYQIQLEEYSQQISEIQIGKDLVRKQLEDQQSRHRQTELQKIQLKDQLNLQQIKNQDNQHLISELKYTIEHMNLQQNQLQQTKNKLISQLQLQLEILSAEHQLLKNQLQFTQSAYKTQKQTNFKNNQVYELHIQNLETKIKQIENNSYETNLLMESQHIEIKQQYEDQENEYKKLDTDRLNLNIQCQSLQKQNQNLSQQITVLQNKLKEELQSRNILQKDLLNVIATQQATIKDINKQIEKSIMKQKNHNLSENEKIQSLAHYEKNQKEYKSRIRQLEDQVKKLENQLSVTHEKMIGMEGHELLVDRIKQLETLINQSGKGKNSNPVDVNNENDKNDKNGKNDKNVEKLQVQVEKQTKSIQKVKQLEEQLNNLRKINKVLQQEKQTLVVEKQKFKVEYDLLSVEMAERYLQDMKKVNVEVVQYCESEEEQQQHQLDHLQEQFTKKQKSHEDSKNQQNIIPKHQQEKLQKIGEKKWGLKKALSMQVGRHAMFPQNKLNKDFQIVQEEIESSFGNQQISRKNEVKIENQQKNPHRQVSVISLKIDHNHQDHYNHRNNHEKNKQQNSIYRKSSGKSQISKKQQDKSSRAKDSYVSGTTYYKYQKVSHRQKIKAIEEELRDFESKQKQWRQLEQYYKVQQIRSQSQIYQLQKQQTRLQNSMKDVNHETLILKKQTLPNELNHKNQSKTSQTQTYIQKSSKLIEANIADPEKLKIFEQFKELTQKHDNTVRQYDRRLKQSQLSAKYLKQKTESLQKYSEGLAITNETKLQQIRKLKQLIDEQHRNHRQAYQDLKLQKSQVEFELGTFHSQSKRYKSRIQQLEDKLRKNDVVDLYKQAQFQAENANRKIIEINRLVYQLRLEKDGFEDEIKILRKKISDLQRKITQGEDQIQRIQKNAEEYKKRQSRYKRELEDKEDNLEKIKDQSKRLNDEISTLKSYQSQQSFDRKKTIDELTNLQHTAERKQYEMVSLKKQIQKLKLLLTEKQQEKVERRSNLKKQIDKLQQSLVGKEKQIIEMQSIIKQLTNRIQMQKGQNKKSLGEKSGMYSEKLKIYVDQITQIRKVLEDNNYEINGLKDKIKQTLQQLEMVYQKYGKLEQKYNDECEEHQKLLQAYQQLKNQFQKMKQTGFQMEFEMENIQNAIKLIKSDFEKEKKEGMAKKKTIEELTKNNQSQLELINNFKIKLSDYQTNSQINKNFDHKLEEVERNNHNLIKQLRQLKYSFEQYRSKFMHSAQDLNNAIKKEEMKGRQKINQLQDQSENMHNIDKKKFENEVVDLLNQTSRLRTQSQKKSEFISELEHKISKLQILPLKFEELEIMYANKQKQCAQYRQSLSSTKFLSQKLTHSENNYSKLREQNHGLSQKLGNSNQMIKELKLEIQEVQKNYKVLENQLTISKNKYFEIQQKDRALKQEFQHLLEMVKSSDNQKLAILNKSEESKEEYSKKIKSLQGKLQIMGSTVSEHGKILEDHYEANMEQLKKQLLSYNQQLMDKNKIIVSLEGSLEKFQALTDQYQKEIDQLKDKQLSNNEIFEMEIQKYKNKLADIEAMYKNQTNSLQMEIQGMSKEMTTLKLKSLSVRQFKNVDESDDYSNNNRVNEKIRAKDNKLQELKKNMLIYEQSIVKLKKNLSMAQQQIQQLTKFEKLYHDSKSQNNKLQFELQNYHSNDRNLMTNLKKQVQCYKQQYQNLRLQHQQKCLLFNSIDYELKTTKQLYNELQSQLEKRKISFREQVHEQSKFNEALQVKRELINQLEYKIHELEEIGTEKDSDLQKKSQYILNLQKKLGFLEKSEAKLKVTLNTKINQEGKHYRNQIRRLSEENQSLMSDLKQFRQKNQFLEKQNLEASTKLSLNQSSIDNLSITVDQLNQRCSQLQFVTKKYNQANEICYKMLFMSLDEAFLHNEINRRFEQKEFQMSNLAEQVEELKFLNERKYMDYDEIKKQNYELQLQLENVEFANQQVDELRQICDKLEQQKKQTLFRQQFLLIQIESIIKSSNGETKSKMLEILNRGRQLI